MVNVPIVFGSCSRATMLLGNKSEALSHLIANVRGQIKSLFRITISSAWLKIRSGCPFPSIANSSSPTLIEKYTLESGVFSLFFNSSGKSAQLDFALTPIMQSPLGVK